ncbi:MAG TPA: M48 family metallopeptidase [Burkholderiales bacterium]|nr:M48 family metallopeptidase [Burkholderiales bacterium]
MTSFGFIFLFVLGLSTLVRIWLGARHIAYIQAHRSTVPAQFASEISLAAHQRAADYTSAKTKLGLVSVVIDALLVLWLTLGGGVQLIYDVAARGFDGEIVRGLALIALLSVLTALVELPLGLYRTFGIEERFGFNKMTPALYWKDFAKNAALAAAFGLPLAACVLWLLEAAGDYWWLYAWLVWVTFNLTVLAIYPTWIAPLFNRFSPLQDVAMKARVEALLARCGFKVKGLMVMDGSKRSSHGNAYFTGFGKTKRIVFFDTLLARLTPPEVEAVLAHELGHFRLRHVIKRMAWIFIGSLVFLWALDFIMHQDWFYAGLNVQERTTAVALVLFFLVAPSFTFLLQPLLASYSRKHEFEADQYAMQNASADELASALVKLYKDNASTLTPDPVHSAFYDSHPPALARISRLQQGRQGA